METCHECKEQFEQDINLHRHLKKHNVSVQDYYHKNEPHYDLYDKRLIEFKNLSDYRNVCFNSRPNLIQFYKEQKDVPALIELTKSLLKYRMQSKKLIYAPSTCELRTCILPSVALLSSRGIDYNTICKEIGLICRYDYNKSVLANNNWSSQLNILVDSREQQEIKFAYPTQVTKLLVGDYTTIGEHFKNVFVERKSLQDLLGTLSKGFDRFNEEIKRAKEFGSYIIVMCERPFVDFLAFNNFDYIHAEATPTFIQHRMRDLLSKHDNLQFLFINGRNEMKDIIQKIFLTSSDVRNIDLQFLQDTKRL